MCGALFLEHYLGLIFGCAHEMLLSVFYNINGQTVFKYIFQNNVDQIKQ